MTIPIGLAPIILPSSRPPVLPSSWLQQQALKSILHTRGGAPPFKHIIIDEYQDTNTIQERIFFELARPTKNICVVGDDDQALYRFRGATVENFVEFPIRCLKELGKKSHKVVLSTNYRSLKRIVGFYKDFIEHETCDWCKKKGSKESYRVTNKNLVAHRTDDLSAVIASTPAYPINVCAEVASLVKKIIASGKVSDPNQIAFLYPSLKTEQVQRMIDALANQELQVYAPRAGNFLEVEEVSAIIGLFQQIVGYPERDEEYDQGNYKAFHDLLDNMRASAEKLMRKDPLLERFIAMRKKECEVAGKDYEILSGTSERYGWKDAMVYKPNMMMNKLAAAAALSPKARKSLTSSWFNKIAEKRLQDNDRPFIVSYIINRASSLDWNVLDLFHHPPVFPSSSPPVLR